MSNSESLNSFDLTILEREIGPLCAREASKRSRGPAPDLDEYKRCYEELFSEARRIALEWKIEKGEQSIIDEDFIPTCLRRMKVKIPDELRKNRGGLRSDFTITEHEFEELNKAFGLLCHDAAWKVIKAYRLEEEENIVQELFMAMLRSAAQYRRKCYFKRSFEYLSELGVMDFPLVQCWYKNFMAHKMEKEEQDNFLEFMDSLPNSSTKPSTDDPLELDEGAARYIKTCIWNQQKTALKDLAKEKNIRRGEVSLSETDGWLNVEEMSSEGEVTSGTSLRDSLFEGVRQAILDRDKRAARTYEILTNPQNDKEVFPRTSEYKLKINSVRKRTKQSYKSIKTDLAVIKGVMYEELKKHKRDLVSG